ncbi:MAG TPA: hypothetical protein VKS79_03625 [Gemmataceae bacterium]|nr:hypothetical protein [Gemmataceae bacterium]
MKRFLTKFFGPARSTRRPQRRASLQLEALEGRLVPTTLILNGSTLNISNIAAGDTIKIQCLQNANSLMEVLDNGNVVNGEKFYKLGLNTINIQGSSNNQVIVDDSNGMPFGPGTNINLSGGISKLCLQGTRTVAGDETFVAGSETKIANVVLLKPATISLDNLTFTLHGTPTVVDEIPITGNLTVQESSSGAQLSQNGFGSFNIPGTACLQELGIGAGTSLVFSQKPNVILSVNAPNASTFLDPASATGLNSFQVEMEGAGDVLRIQGTEAGVATYVFGQNSGQTVLVGTTYGGPGAVYGSVNVTCYGSNANVDIWTNNAEVDIQGNSTTNVVIGGTLDNGYTTQYIDANIVVNGASTLVVDDAVNAPQYTNANGVISGNGLFGNNGVTVSYSNVLLAGVIEA